MKSIFRFLAALAGFNSVWEIGYAVAHCTAGDVLIGLACAIAMLALTGWSWPLPGRLSARLLGIFVAFAVTYTILSKWLNTPVRLIWAYLDLMPVLPLFGTCVAPLLQWIVAPALAFWLCSAATVVPYRWAKH